MADIQTVDYGEPHWDDKVNRNFAALNADAEKVNGVVAGLQWTERTAAGIVLANGFKFSDYGPNGYETCEIGNKTFVHLTLHLQRTEAFNGSGCGTVVTIPDAISFVYPMNGISTAKILWGVAGANKINFGTFNDIVEDWPTGEGADNMYAVDALYVK